MPHHRPSFVWLAGLVLAVLVAAFGTRLAPAGYNRLGGVHLPARLVTPLPPVDPLDGKAVPADLAARPPLAVVVDNHPEARPQWGLSLASRVYEALTEGGVTRYLAVYQARDAERVGPVRSIRTQFLGYTLEMHAALAHVGGNEDALALLADLPVTNLDELRHAGTYRRIPRRGVAFEHTTFTSTAALRALTEDAGWRESGAIDRPRWKDDAPEAGRPERQEVTVPFSDPRFAVTWEYRPALNDYRRMLAGRPDVDAATGQMIAARTVIIAVVTRTHGRTPIGEDTWTFADTGAGPAWVVQDGTVVAGTWLKPSRAARLRVVNGRNEEITLNRGPQWVEIVPPEVAPAFAPSAAGSSAAPAASAPSPAKP